MTPSTDDALRVSYSAVQDWRACPQRYWYSYVERLEPKVTAAPPELGRMLHHYLETYYSGVMRRSRNHLAAHKHALESMNVTFAEECQQLSWLAASLGESQAAKELSSLVDLAMTLARTYYRVRGKEDAQTHKVILVEQDISAPVVDGVVLPGVVDLVTEDKEGRKFLWEHKTTKNVPTQGRRFRDLQTLVYVVLLEMSRGIHVDGIMWNYMRTYPPVQPEVLQTGKLTKRKDLVTTLELYRAAISANGLEIEEYSDALALIKERELQTMFPRIELAIVQSEDILLRDFVLSALEIRKARSDPSYIPIRNVSSQCDWCPYVKLCQAALLAGDDSDLRKRHFTSRNDRKKKGESSGRSSTEDDFAVLLTE